MQNFCKHSGRDVKMERPLQERNGNGKAEDNMDRIEACSIKIAISKTGGHCKHKEGQEMDRMVVECSVRLESRKDKTRT